MNPTEDGLQRTIEQQVLGSLLIDGSSRKDRIYTALDRIEPRDFYFENHQILYATIVQVFVRHYAVDTVVLAAELTKKNLLEKVGGAVYLAELTANCSLYGAAYAYSELKERAKVRSLAKECASTLQRIRDAGDETAGELIDHLQSSLYEIQYERKSGRVNILQVAEQVIERAKNLEAGSVFGYRWGLTKLDFLTSGIEKGKTYVVGATKKSGKTKLVINTLHTLHREGVKTLYLSLQMDGESVVRELLSRFADIENTALKRRLSDGVECNLRAAAEVISDGNIIVDTEPYLGINQIRLKVQKAAQSGVTVVFLDYLQRINFELRQKKELNFATVVAQTVSQLADIAKDNGVAIIFLSQLANRAENEQATIADLKDSGGIAEGVDCILILNNQDRIRKNYQNKTNEVWITVEQRSGACGRVKCSVDLSRATYKEKYEELTAQEALNNPDDDVFADGPE